MAKGPKGFSLEEKAALRARLCDACEQSWAVHGYKKTTVGELAQSVGIATGSFYLLYASKEELFCATFRQVQERLREVWRRTLGEEPNKESFKRAMCWLYKEYSRYPFLYDFASPDFMALLNRLPEAERQALSAASLSVFEYTVDKAGLRLQVEKEKALAALSTLLYTVSFAGKGEYDHYEVFELLLEGTIRQIFE